jgi:hypothetical protein
MKKIITINCILFLILVSLFNVRISNSQEILQKNDMNINIDFRKPTPTSNVIFFKSYNNALHQKILIPELQNKRILIATGADPTPTSTPTPTPTYSCSSTSKSASNMGTAYFIAEGIGARAFSVNYYLSYFKCTDNVDEFRLSLNNAKASICGCRQEQIVGFNVYVTLRKLPSQTSWFGPALIYENTGTHLCSTGAFSVTKSPSQTYWSPQNNDAYFNGEYVYIEDGGYVYSGFDVLSSLDDTIDL